MFRPSLILGNVRLFLFVLYLAIGELYKIEPTVVVCPELLVGRMVPQCLQGRMLFDPLRLGEPKGDGHLQVARGVCVLTQLGVTAGEVEVNTGVGCINLHAFQEGFDSEIVVSASVITNAFCL